MAEVLSENEVFLFRASRIVFIHLNIVDPLLQFLVVLLLKRVDIEDKEVAVVATNPSKIIMHTAAEKSMTWCLLHGDGLQRLSVIHMQLVTFPSWKDESGFKGSSRWNKRAGPIANTQILDSLKLSS